MAIIDNAFRVDALSIEDVVAIFQGSADPRTGAGQDAPVGSLFLETTNGISYMKIGVGVYDWAPNSSTPYPATPPTTIYVSTVGNDLFGDGSFVKPYLTIKKGVAQANLIATALAPVSVKILEGVYNEVNPIAVTNVYVKVMGSDETRTVAQPTINGQPLFVLSSGVAGKGPIMATLTCKGDATYKATAGGSLVQLNGAGVYILSNVVVRSGNVGVEAGAGTIATSQITTWNYSASIDNVTGIISRQNAVIGVQFYMSMNDTIGVQSNDTSEIELGTYNIQGTHADPAIANTGIVTNNTSTVIATNGVITRCAMGLQANDSSTARFIGIDFDGNTIDFNQTSSNAVVRIQGTIDKTKQLITNGANVSLNYTNAATGDYIVGAATATGIPGKEFRVRDADGRVAIGDNATDENIASGGVGGSRSINIIDTNGNARLWRFVADAGQDPAFEWIKGINPANPDGFGDAPIVSITAATDTITIDVSGAEYNNALDATPGIDRSTLALRAFPAGRVFQVNGTAANNGVHTVLSSTYNSVAQTISIVVSNNITASAGAVGTVVFGGGAGRLDGPNPGNPAAAVTAGTGNVWWDMFLQEDDHFVMRHRTGGGGDLANEKVRIYPDRSEWLGASTYGDTDNALIVTMQHQANAVNNILLRNSATTVPVLLQAQGTDTNIDVNILPKGTGVISVIGTSNYENNVTVATDIPNKAYVDNAIAATGVSAMQIEIDNIEASLGAALNASGTFNNTTFATFTNVVNPTSVTNALSQLDSAITKDYLHRHNGAVTQTFSTPQTVLFNTSIRQDAPYVYAAGVTTINQTGWYKVTYDISVNGLTNTRSSSQAQLLLNGAVVTGSITYGYHQTTSSECTHSATVIINITSGQTLQVQVLSIVGVNLITMANSCRLTIQSLL